MDNKVTQEAWAWFLKATPRQPERETRWNMSRTILDCPMWREWYGGLDRLVHWQPSTPWGN